MAIYVYSGPIRSGKTTRLQKWSSQQNVAGFLTPDQHNKRVLLELPSGIQHPFEVTSPGPGIIQVGRFHFLESAFDKANKILNAAFSSSAEWIIADEIGKLEVEQNLGLEPQLSSLIHHFHQLNSPQNLLLVIRETLLPQAIEKYHLQSAIIINDSFFE
jgi:nucleoside-triphosphatase THEP1